MAEEKKEGKSESNGGGIKMLLIILIVLILAAGGGAFAYMKMANREPQAAPVNTMGPTLPLDSFIVNLDEPGGTRYLKLSLAYEMNKPLDPQQQKLTLRIRDQVIVYLSGLRITDVQRSDAKKKLKKELIALANKVYGQAAVKDVYFKEFVIQ